MLTRAMKTLQFASKRKDRYGIFIKRGLLNEIGSSIRRRQPDIREIIIVTDRNVQSLYANLLMKKLVDSGFETKTLVVEPGEQSKTLDTATVLWENLTTLGCRRRSVLIALGGGVITDLTGFVAASYMRGIPYINVPTTLVAQIDAAIGGKVGIDHERAKNLIGSFYHPRAVFVDPALLQTLSTAEMRNGLAEAIKVATIGSLQLFEFIEQNVQELLNKDIVLLDQMAKMAIKAKLDLLSPDPFEYNLKRLLNFGHTIGHALETASRYKELAHGEAIAIGMATATRIARARGVCNHETADRILALIDCAQLPVYERRILLSEIWQALSIIRAIRDGHFYEVLPVHIGHCIFTDELSENDLKQYLI